MIHAYWWKYLETGISPKDRRSVFLRTTLKKLIEEGGSTGRHSALGMTLPYFITELEKARIPYTLIAIPSMGYSIEVEPPEKRFKYD